MNVPGFSLDVSGSPEYVARMLEAVQKVLAEFEAERIYELATEMGVRIPARLPSPVEVQLRVRNPDEWEWWPPERGRRKCEHKWRDYGHFGGDFEQTPVVCRDCGEAAPPEVARRVLSV